MSQNHSANDELFFATQAEDRDASQAIIDTPRSRELAHVPAFVQYPQRTRRIFLASGAAPDTLNFDFTVRSIVIQNLGTNAYIYCVEAGIYLTTSGMPQQAINLPQGTTTLTLQYHTKQFDPTPPSAVAGEYATLWAYDEWISPAAAGAAAGGAVGTQVTVVGPLDAGNVAVSVENWPAPFHVTVDNGSFAVTQSGAWTVSVSGTVAIAGTVAVSNFPATQPVSGTVAVSNFPATQPVSGTVAVSGAVNPSTENPFTLVSAASTNATVVKASAGTLRTIQVINNNAAPVYLKVFNKATTPVPGTDTPVLNYEVPANGAGANLGAGFVLELNCAFASGIGIALTAGQALNNNTAVAAGDVTLNMSYI